MEDEYYRVTVAKKSYTEVYIKVPKGDKVEFKDRTLVKEATVKTVDKYDWEDYGWENDLEIEMIEHIDEKAAKGYDVYDAREL